MEEKHENPAKFFGPLNSASFVVGGQGKSGKEQVRTL